MKVILLTSPIIILIEMLLFSFIVEMIREPSDISLFFGVMLLTFTLVINYFLIKFILKQSKRYLK
jgi:uncharacterized membrane protein